MSHRPDLGKLTSEEKDALIEALLAQLEELRSEVAQLQEEAAELQRRLGLDSSTSGKPPSRDGYGKKPRPVNLREQTGWKSGGQEGHEGRNLRQVEHPDHVVEHWPGVGAGCGAGVGRAEGMDHRKRQLFDLPKPQRIEVTEPRAYRCRCPQCGQDTDAAFPASVTAGAQYGPHLAALVVYLQHWHFLPEDRLGELLREVCGVERSAATSAAMGQRKAEEWTELAIYIGEQVKPGPVNHLDETGLRIAGVWQWLHVASTWLLTWYRTSRPRGTMLEGVGGIVVQDFWRPYFTLDGVTHALGNAHPLRELKALSESEHEPWARTRFRFLQQACHAANLARGRPAGLKPALRVWLAARSDRIVAQGLVFPESRPPLAPRSRPRRGRPRRRPGHNLLLRLQSHKDAAVRFLTNPDVPFTNNQAERDLRMRKLKQKISGCFRADTGAQTFAILRTVLSTARKQGWNILETLTQPSDSLVRNLRTA